jgi:hypothetical protein
MEGISTGFGNCSYITPLHGSLETGVDGGNRAIRDHQRIRENPPGEHKFEGHSEYNAADNRSDDTPQKPQLHRRRPEYLEQYLESTEKSGVEQNSKPYTIAVVAGHLRGYCVGRHESLLLHQKPVTFQHSARRGTRRHADPKLFGQSESAPTAQFPQNPLGFCVAATPPAPC